MLAVAATIGIVLYVPVSVWVSVPVLFRRFDRSGMVKPLFLLIIIIVGLVVPSP